MNGTTQVLNIVCRHVYTGVSWCWCCPLLGQEVLNVQTVAPVAAGLKPDLVILFTDAVPVAWTSSMPEQYALTICFFQTWMPCTRAAYALLPAQYASSADRCLMLETLSDTGQRTWKAMQQKCSLQSPLCCF